jgi:N6-adenosine-specific RNA methylase IME4
MTTLLAAYDDVCVAITRANAVSDVLKVRDHIEHIKLHGRQVRDRALIEQATVLQMRAERRLGELLQAAEDAGLIGKGRRMAGDETRATLAEIGVDKKLSMTAHRAAALKPADFEQLIETTREKVRSSRAIVVDPVGQATKEAEISARRQAHAERTRGGCTVKDLGELALSGYRAGAIGADPQWKFMARSDAGDARSANTHYKTEDLARIKDIPVGQLAADDSALFMWVVDWFVHGAIELIEAWGFSFKTVAFTWAKTNGEDVDNVFDDSTWAFGQGFWTRGNPEMCLLATKGNPKRLHADVRQLIVTPLMDHSVKPDAWLERIERLVEGPYLELNARRRRPGWTAWGDELKWEGAAA